MMISLFSLLFLTNSFQFPENNIKKAQYQPEILEEILNEIIQDFKNLNSVAYEVTSSIAIVNSSFISNQGQSGDPGAIKAVGDYIVRVENSNFVRNAGDLKGGAIYIDILEFNVTESLFFNNECEAGGGAIYIDRSQSESILIDTCIFEHNQKSSIFINQTAFDDQSNSKEIRIINSNFTNCKSENGGAIFIFNITSNVIISNCSFTNNEAQNDGGCIYALKCQFLSIVDSKFTTNKAISGRGGAICCDHLYDEENNGDEEILNVSYFVVNDCYFTECESGLGGALYIQVGKAVNDEETRIEDCCFINCFASNGEGYSISCRSNRLILSGCLFTGHRRGLINSIHCIVYSEIHNNTFEDNIPPLFQNNTFEDNIAVNSLIIKVNESVSIDQLKFNNLGSESAITSLPIINLDLWSIADNLVLENCSFTNIVNLQCISSTESKFISRIKHCNFTNISCKLPDSGSINEYGSCISAFSYSINIYVDGSKFIDVEVMNGHGGAIYAFIVSIDISRCTFINCKASSNKPASSEEVSAQGGAIYLKIYPEVIDFEFISQCLFENCTSTYSGGAIFIYYAYDEYLANTDVVDIHNCNFSYCKSGVEGGAISSGIKLGNEPAEGGSDIRIYNCFFIRCESGRGGAAFFQDGTQDGDEQTVIMSCYFTNCFAYEGEGYAISIRSYRIGLFSLEFKDHQLNTNNETHSIVYLEMNEAEQNLNVYDLKYEHNSGVSGLTLITASSVTLYGFIFRNYYDISPCINFDQWSITNEDTSNFIELEGFKFNNIKDSRCIYMSQKNTFQAKINRCTFTNNSVENIGTKYSSHPCGSCILCKESGDAVLNDCTFTNCTAAYDGGAIYAEAHSIDINNCTFINCHALSGIDGHSRGGAIYLNAQSAIEYEVLRNNTFENCTSTLSGGALFVYCKESIEDDNSSLIQIIKCNFTDCNSGQEGGAVCSGSLYKDELTGDERILGDNDMKIYDCYFIRCESSQGGALYFQDGTKEGNEETEIMHCEFYDCYASGELHKGYAIHCRSYQLTLTNCQFCEHQRGTPVPGDCIVYIEMNEPEVSPVINSLIFERNTGVSGLIVKTSKETTITNLTFNNIQDQSPCINLDEWVIQSELTITQSSFSNIFNARCIMSKTKTKRFSTVIENCEFINNSIRKSTRGEYLSGCGSCILCQHKADVIILSCNFTSNTAESNGGAIYAETEAIDITRCHFTLCSSAPDNDDGYGGAVYLNQTSTGNREYIYLCHFMNCSASFSGGGLFVYCRDTYGNKNSDEMLYTVVVVLCEFTECTSNVEGGAISSGLYNEEIKQIEGDNDFQINECIFTRCKSWKGGALYFQDGTQDGDEETIIVNCHFYECYAKGHDHEGYAISCRSYRIILEKCDFHDHKQLYLATSTDCIVYIEINELEVTPIINNLIFEENQGVSGIVVKSCSNIIVQELHFNHQSDRPCINISQWEAKNFVTIKKSEFNNTHNGRCILMTSESDSFQFNLIGCEFINNIYEKQVSGSLNEIINDQGFGGSIYCQFNSNISITNCTFVNNTATLGGGAIYARTKFIEFKVNYFINCTSTGFGGAIYLSSRIENIFSSNYFEMCNSTDGGGSVFIESDVNDSITEADAKESLPEQATNVDENDEMSLINKHKYHVFINVSSFTKINHLENGGAIQIINVDIHCTDSTFDKCKTSKAGGAIYANISNNNKMNFVKLENILFNDNEAEFGGAIYAYSTNKNSIVVIQKNEFNRNTAHALKAKKTKYGGSAIFVTARKSIIVDNSFFQNNGPGPYIRVYNHFYRRDLTTSETERKEP